MSKEFKDWPWEYVALPWQTREQALRRASERARFVWSHQIILIFKDERILVGPGGPIDTTCPPKGAERDEVVQAEPLEPDVVQVSATLVLPDELKYFTLKNPDAFHTWQWYIGSNQSGEGRQVLLCASVLAHVAEQYITRIRVVRGHHVKDSDFDVAVRNGMADAGLTDRFTQFYAQVLEVLYEVWTHGMQLRAFHRRETDRANVAYRRQRKVC